MTRWISPDGSVPLSYHEWQNSISKAGPFQISLVQAATSSMAPRAGVGFCVVVNSTLYDSIQTALDLFILDLTGEGYDVELYTTSGGTPDNLRAFLQGKYALGMEGCLLLGDLPVPWYETDFGDPPEHAEFPIDLYYMDMNGSFDDTDFDGMYDAHTGDVAPEIWMGRLTASPLILDGADEISLVRNYFRKNHLYRCGLLPVNNQALVYIDDDWAPGDWWNQNVGEAYSNRTFVKDRWTTWDTDYENRLPQNYEFIQVCVHSYSGGHSFKDPDENWGWTMNWEMKAIGPVAHFYNLFACSNARYVEADYMSGWYIFRQDHGLSAIGSTKSGSMLYFEDFYGPFGEGKTIGEAFQDWFTARASGGFDEWEISWFYGMTLNGDPTLRIQQKPSSEWVQYDNGAASYMMSLPDGSGWDLYNVRFTAEKVCTLMTVSFEGDFRGTPGARLYLWNSDGTFPTTVIDSIDIPEEDIPDYGTVQVDVSERSLSFEPGQEFHIGVTVLQSDPEDTIWLYMDNGDPAKYRSCVNDNGTWRTNADIWGNDYNFLIRAEMRYPPEPEVEITTLTLPDETAGQYYDQSLDVVNGVSPYSWDLSAGNLPDGLTLDSSAGNIVGYPIVSDTFHFTVRVTDSDMPAASDVQHLSIAVAPAICGDIDGSSDDPDVGDLTYLVAYLFQSGEAPPVLDAANVDGSSSINVGDLTYLVAYLFQGGPAPTCAPVK
ncbi:MAG: putative Ig domain-containing protein [bacterium]